MTISTSRRGFISILGAVLVAAPAIVRVSSIMPVKNMLVESFTEQDLIALLTRLDERASLPDHWYAREHGMPAIGEINESTRRIEVAYRAERPMTISEFGRGI